MLQRLKLIDQIEICQVFDSGDFCNLKLAPLISCLSHKQMELVSIAARARLCLLLIGGHRQTDRQTA